MRYGGTLIVVKDMAKSRNFYENIMEQKVLMDLGEHISLENGLSLQTNYEAITGTTLPLKSEANNFQLYFEAENIEECEKKLEQTEDVEFIHHLKEYPWGQQSMRFYDPDKYIIEVSESMESVIKRCLNQGLPIAEISKRTMYPASYIETFLQ